MLNQDEEKGHCQKVGDTSGEIIQHRSEVPEKEKDFHSAGHNLSICKEYAITVT